MKDAREALVEKYNRTLREYLIAGEEAALKGAYELARQALSEGIGVLEMAALHHEALITTMGNVTSMEEGMRVIHTAGVLFVESLTPYEMTHRTFQESTAALRRLNEKLEDEAKRIAHALHAEAGQLLASVHIALDTLSPELPPEARRHLSRIDGLLDQISDQIRRLSHELRPTILDDLGLLPALRFLAEGISSRSSIPVVVQGKLEKRLPASIETAVYRTVQEALNNMNRHARATRAFVEVSNDLGHVSCCVKDDGVGFDLTEVLDNKACGGLGLMGMRERVSALGGMLKIRSAPGKGTEIRVTIPTEG